MKCFPSMRSMQRMASSAPQAAHPFVGDIASCIEGTVQEFVAERWTSSGPGSGSESSPRGDCRDNTLSKALETSTPHNTAPGLELGSSGGV